MLMSRPSHWILGFFAVVGGVLWWSGTVHDYLAARPAESLPRSEGEPRSVAVRHNVELPKPAPSEVAGTIVDRRGWPVVAAKVRLVDGTETVETDAFGRFRIRGPGAVNRTLRIEAPGRQAPLLVQGGVDELALVMQDALPWLESAAVAGLGGGGSGGVTPNGPDELLFGEGWVRTAAGEPAGGAKVTVRETGACARTDESGRYVLPLPAGPFTLVSWDERGEVVQSETVTPPRRQGKLPLPELRLAAGHTLRGRLRDAEGQSLVGAAIVIDNVGVSRTVRTEQGGLFVVDGLVSGELTVTVLPFRGHLGRRIPANVVGDADLEDLVVVHAEREPLRVLIVDQDGVARPFVHVVADQDAGLRRAYGQSDVRGMVVLTGLGVGETRIEVRDADHRAMQVTSWDAAARRLSVAP